MRQPEEARLAAKGEVEVTLWIDLAEPVRGSLRAAGGRRDSFSGWLELNMAMRRLLEDARGEARTGPSSALR